MNDLFYSHIMFMKYVLWFMMYYQNQYYWFIIVGDKKILLLSGCSELDVRLIT